MVFKEPLTELCGTKNGSSMASLILIFIYQNIFQNVFQGQENTFPILQY